MPVVFSNVYSRLGVVVVSIYLAYSAYAMREIKRPPGVLVSRVPLQKNLPSTAKPILFKKDVLQPLADFFIEARVLAKKRYIFDSNSKYSPFDLALGWNKMSDSSVLDQLSVSQSGRFYWVSWNKPVLPFDTIFNNSSNMHIIPGSNKVKEVLSRIRVGHVVRLKGHLVRVDRRDGGEWMSSLTREDRGDGACEIVYVKQAKILH